MACCCNDSPVLYYLRQYRRHVSAIFWSFLYGSIPICDLISDYWLCLTFLWNDELLFFSLSLFFIFLGNRLRSLMHYFNDWFNYRLDITLLYLLSSYFFGYTPVECCFNRSHAFKDLPLALACDLGLIFTFPLYIFLLIWSTITSIHEETNPSMMMERNVHIRFEIFHILPQFIITITAFFTNRITFMQFLPSIIADFLEFCRLWNYYELPNIFFLPFFYCCGIHPRNLSFKICCEMTQYYYNTAVISCCSKNNLHLVKNTQLNAPVEIKLKDRFDKTSNVVNQVITTNWNTQLLLEDSSSEEESSSSGVPFKAIDEPLWLTIPLNNVKIEGDMMLVDGERVMTGRQANFVQFMRERRMTTDSSTVGMGCSLGPNGVLRVYVRDEKVYASLNPSHSAMSPLSYSINTTHSTPGEASFKPSGTPVEERDLLLEGDVDWDGSPNAIQKELAMQGLGGGSIPIVTNISASDLQNIMPQNSRRGILRRHSIGGQHKKVKFSLNVHKGALIMNTDEGTPSDSGGSFQLVDSVDGNDDYDYRGKQIFSVGTPINKWMHLQSALNPMEPSHHDSEAYSVSVLRDSLATISPDLSFESSYSDETAWRSFRRKTYDAGNSKNLVGDDTSTYAALGLVDKIGQHDHILTRGGSNFSLPNNVGTNNGNLHSERIKVLQTQTTWPTPFEFDEQDEFYGSLTYEDDEVIYEDVYE